MNSERSAIMYVSSHLAPGATLYPNIMPCCILVRDLVTPSPLV